MEAGPRSAGAIWIGVCSTWNQPSSDHWRRYQRALRQRNAALKAGQRPQPIRAWDPELLRRRRGGRSRTGSATSTGLRAAAVRDVGQRLLGAGRSSWPSARVGPAERSLARGARGILARDRERGLTHVGPHRADLSVRVDGSAGAGPGVPRAAETAGGRDAARAARASTPSRGPSVAALLVDDPAAELDASEPRAAARGGREPAAQLFVTALDPANPALQGLPHGPRFHVEHGAVSRSDIIRRLFSRVSHERHRRLRLQ